jgi:hypothetical protein
MTAGAHGREQQQVDLGALVGQWLDWTEVATALGIPVSRVGRLVKEHRLASAVPDPGAGARVPEAFLQDGEIVKGLPGLVTVLHDAGYDDAEIIAWVFTDDPTLPGRPIDALRENRGSEVKRRAQAMG